MTADGNDFDAIIAVLKQFSDSDDDMRGMANTFFTVADDILNTLQESCTSDRCKAWTDAAHKLKGSAGMIKAKELATLSDRAEKLGTAPGSEKVAMLKELRQSVDALRTGLKDICRVT